MFPTRADSQIADCGSFIMSNGRNSHMHSAMGVGYASRAVKVGFCTANSVSLLPLGATIMTVGGEQEACRMSLSRTKHVLCHTFSPFV